MTDTGTLTIVPFPEPAAVPAKRLLIPVGEAAELLGISRTATYEAIYRGDIPHVRFGRRIMVPVKGLLKAVKEQTRYGT